MPGQAANTNKSEPKPDRRRLKTRSALIGAGQRLFAARSIDGVTVDDIVEAANVAKGTFYNHFNDKDNLAETIVELVQGDCEREVYAVNRGITNPATRVARAMVALIAYANSHPDRYRSMVNLGKRRSDIEAPINAGLRRDIETGVEQGIFPSTSIESGMLAVFGMIASAIDYLAGTEEGTDRTPIAKEMSFILLRSLGVSTKQAASIAEDAVSQLL